MCSKLPKSFNCKSNTFGKKIEALVDSSASENFIDSKIASQLNLRVEGPSSQIAMASEGFAVKTLGKVNATLKQFFSSLNIASSHSTQYHPKGNFQCERINQTIWRTVKLLLHEKNLSEIPQALHCVRSLVCLATNKMPHERMFKFPWRAMTGTAMPSRLLSQGEVSC